MSNLYGRQGISGPASLERRYRRLLACYPRAYRRENEEEILAVLLACAKDGQERPGLAASADLIRSALRKRLWPASRPPRTVRTAARLVGAGVAAQAAALIINVATVGSVRSAVARRYPSGAAPLVYHAVTARLVTDQVSEAITLGVWLLLAWALVRGSNLARFAFAVSFGVTSLFMLRAIDQNAAVSAPADVAAGAVLWLFGLTVSVLLFTGASNRYYRPEPRPVTSWRGALRHYLADSPTPTWPRH
jgi:hypothetical protein